VRVLQLAEVSALQQRERNPWDGPLERDGKKRSVCVCYVRFV